MEILWSRSSVHLVCLHFGLQPRKNTGRTHPTSNELWFMTRSQIKGNDVVLVGYTLLCGANFNWNDIQFEWYYLNVDLQACYSHGKYSNLKGVWFNTSSDSIYCAMFASENLPPRVSLEIYLYGYIVSKLFLVKWSPLSDLHGVRWFKIYT